MKTRTKRGFTLVEVMIAITIMAMCMAMVVATITMVFKAKTIGEEQLESLHHGEFIMELLAEALRSAAFIGEATEKFGFRLEDGGDDFDAISWVTSSSAFIQPGSPLKHGLHRLQVFISDDEEGLSVVAYPYLVDDSEENDQWEPEEEWVVSRRVKELNCRVYNFQSQDWEDEWESERSIPQWVEITMRMEVKIPGEDKSEMKELVRMVQIPVGLFARNQSRIAAEQQEEAQAEQEDISNNQQLEQDQAAQALQQQQQGGGAQRAPAGGIR